jgi:hypothetical protein
VPYLLLFICKRLTVYTSKNKVRSTSVSVVIGSNPFSPQANKGKTQREAREEAIITVLAGGCAAGRGGVRPSNIDDRKKMRGRCYYNLFGWNHSASFRQTLALKKLYFF